MPTSSVTAPANVNDRILVADIGGTHARFAVASMASVQEKSTIDHFQVFECADHADMETLIQHYIEQLPDEKPDYATLAIAGPVADNTGMMTNLGWKLNGEILANKLGFNGLYLLNDFAALAMSAPKLTGDDLITIRSGHALKNSPISVFGPGTGFGAALLVPTGDSFIPLPSEGGHMSLAPKDPLEIEIWKTLAQEMGRVSVETLLSGVGLMRLYRALCSIHNSSPRNYDPRTISQLATEGSDEICSKALTVFCNLLGSVAGDIALVQGAKGGVFLGGGILPKMVDFLLSSDFEERFLDKEPMQKYLKPIPIHLIIAPDAALIGAAEYGRNMLKAAK